MTLDPAPNRRLSADESRPVAPRPQPEGVAREHPGDDGDRTDHGPQDDVREAARHLRQAAQRLVELTADGRGEGGELGALATTLAIGWAQVRAIVCAVRGLGAADRATIDDGFADIANLTHRDPDRLIDEVRAATVALRPQPAGQDPIRRGDPRPIPTAALSRHRSTPDVLTTANTCWMITLDDAET